MPKRVLLIAATTGYQTRAFAAAGERLGYDIRLATDRCHVLDDPWGDRAIPLRFELPEFAAKVLAQVARDTAAFDGIMAVGDRPAHLAALAAPLLGIAYTSAESVENCSNKYLARERFRAHGLNVPDFYRIAVDQPSAEAAARARYPCVLKPLELSASRGVIRANDPREFTAAFQRIRGILDSADIVRLHLDQDRFIHVEDYIDGQEYALEGLLVDGVLQTVALFDKPDPLTGPYFEESLYITPSRAPAQVYDAIETATKAAIRALGLTRGPVHAEMRVNAQGVWMLEVAARPIGGLCAQVLRFESGLTFEEVLLMHAAGDPLPALRLQPAARGVMMIPIPRSGVFYGVRGVDTAGALPGIENVEITAKEGQRLVPLPEGASYLGFIFAAGDRPEYVEQCLRKAHGRLEFEILEALPVL